VLDITADQGQSFVSSTDRSSSPGDFLEPYQRRHQQHRTSDMRYDLNGGAAGSGPPSSMATLKAKGARRKLSFTAPMLGFGKKDKHKDKDKEKERDRGGWPVS
jgi:hypothetical protein